MALLRQRVANFQYNRTVIKGQSRASLARRLRESGPDDSLRAVREDGSADWKIRQPPGFLL